MAVGCNVLTLPKTIDNDVADRHLLRLRFAVSIATGPWICIPPPTPPDHGARAMGNKAGGSLGAGHRRWRRRDPPPGIPLDLVVAESIRERDRRGKRFNIVAVAEGAQPGWITDDERLWTRARGHVGTRVARRRGAHRAGARHVLGYVQRGGSPTPPTVCWRPSSAPRQLSFWRRRCSIMVASRGRLEGGAAGEVAENVNRAAGSRVDHRGPAIGTCWRRAASPTIAISVAGADAQPGSRSHRAHLHIGWVREDHRDTPARLDSIPPPFRSRDGVG